MVYGMQAKLQQSGMQSSNHNIYHLYELQVQVRKIFWDFDTPKKNKLQTTQNVEQNAKKWESEREKPLNNNCGENACKIEIVRTKEMIINRKNVSRVPIYLWIIDDVFVEIFVGRSAKF